MTRDYVVVCIATNEIPDAFETQIKKVFSDFKLQLFQTLKTGSLKYFLKVTELNFDLLNSSLMHLSSLYQIDIAFIPKSIFEENKKLVIFDMDSTLITAEVIDEMALKHGVGEKVKMITARAMNGELDFNQSLTERVALLKGFHRSHMQEIMQSLRFTPGTQDFIKRLKAQGIKTAIASGGFEYFAHNIQAQLQIDYVFANQLVFENDQLTGKIPGSIINAEAKERIVEELAQKENLSLNQVVAIGDGANDIPMLLKAGMGMAIHAKEKVQKMARYRINYGPMTHALSFMNLDES